MTDVRDSSLSKCQVGHMKFHVAIRGRGVPLTLLPSRGGGGSCLNCSNKIIKKIARSLRSLDFYKLNCY